MTAKRLRRDELVARILELLQSEPEAEPRYYTQDDSPLGRRRHLELIRSGAIKGWEDGRKKFALRSDVHAYIEAHPVRPKVDDAEADELDELLKEAESR